MVKKKDEIPQWVSDEIKNAKFEKPSSLKRTGYFLEVYDKYLKAEESDQESDQELGPGCPGLDVDQSP